MTILYSDPVFLQDETGNPPEYPARILPAVRRVNQIAIHAGCLRRSWVEVSDARLERVHARKYIDFVQDFCLQGGGYISDDSFIGPQSYQVARMAVGATCDAVEQIVQGANERAFCLVRPPGHHATSDAAMGYCLFNNVAVGARLAIDELGLDRVMIIDWDVHHGNGTQDIFWEDGQVGFLSIHRASLYHETGTAAETGAGKGLGTTVNVPVEFGTSRDVYFEMFTAAVERLAEKIKPQLILISAGFDSHKDDPIGSLGLESEDFGRLTRIVMDVAAVHASDRVVSVLEGGYNPHALAESIEHHLLEMTSA